MNRRPQKVNGLVLRNYITSTVLSFLIIVFLAVMFGFDLEDQIFENQISIKADQLIAAPPLEHGTRATVSGLEMQHFQGTAAMPKWLSSQVNLDWPAGEYEVFGGEHGHFHLAVRGSGDAKQYLIFNARPYVRSTRQVQGFVLLIAFMGVLMLAVSIFFLLRMTKKLSAPIEKMASAALSDTPIDPEQIDLAGAPVELNVLARAIAAKDERINKLMERERQFNRDVSHELRTPLAVAVGAAEIIEKGGYKSAAFSRLESALANMRLLTEGILWLGRDATTETKSNAWAACQCAIDANEHLIDKAKVDISISGENDVEIPIPGPVADVIIGNLVRNAICYTEEGAVTISVAPDSIEIKDSGVGMDQSENDNLGFGIGLSLVNRLSVHFGINVSVNSPETGGTIANISW